jgi:Flp pilus assembly protein TadG
MLARFARDESAAPAIEFAFVALPFFALMLAIVEAAMSFFAGQVLETALRDASRIIRTGEAQNTTGFNKAAFQQRVCDRIPGLMSCAGVTVDVRSYSSFASADLTTPRSNGNFNPNGTQFSMGAAGSIVVARAFYEFPSFTNLLGSSLSNQTNGRILLVATSAFRNEPFASGGS